MTTRSEMNARAIFRRAEPVAPIPVASATHRYAIGQTVLLKVGYGRRIQSEGSYKVVATLPPVEHFPQYRIRNEREPYERVTTEDTLELVETSDTILAKGSDGHGQGANA